MSDWSSDVCSSDLGCIAVLSAFITVVEIVLAILGMQYARISVANDYMAFGKIITQALAAIFVVLAPVVAVMAGVVFVLSLISLFSLNHSLFLSLRTALTESDHLPCRVFPILDRYAAVHIWALRGIVIDFPYNTNRFTQVIG